jgi:DNA-binding FadR family transcriptional regulator
MRRNKVWSVAESTVNRFRSTSLASPGRMKEALEEHRKIVEAISERNIALAQSLAQEHIENAENRMLEAIQKNGMEETGTQEDGNE